MNSPRRWTAIPAARSSATVLAMRLRLLLGALFGSAALGLLSILLVLGRGGSGAASTDAVDPRSTTAAVVIATDYLAGRSTALPVAKGVDAAFGRPADAPAAGLDVEAATAGRVTRMVDQGVTYDTVEVTAVASGRPLRVRVVLAVTADGPVLAANPTLMGIRVDRGVEVSALDWSTYQGTADGVAQNVADAVAKWATAYAADDAQALVQITGNTAPNANYRGLGGFTVTAVTTHRYYRSGEGLVVRARVLFSSASAEKLMVQSEFDLLVLNPDAQFPNVAAWGAAGAGPTLTATTNVEPARAS